jgi:hypothetical protein
MRLALVGFALASLASASSLRRSYLDEAQLRRDLQEREGDPLLSPGSAVLQAASLQHGLAVADFFWLGIVQAFARPELGDVGFDRIDRWADIVTDLDPSYFVAYHASAIHLSVYGARADASDRLLRKGRQHLPDSWLLPFMLGYNAYFLRGDALAASEHWASAAGLPDVPRFVPSLAARARFQAGDPLAAEQMLIEMLEWLPEGPHREDAAIRLKMLRSEPVLTLYDQACERLRRERGGALPTAEELFEKGLVTAPPRDLLGAKIVLDENCRARTEFIRVREDEASKRIGQRDLQTQTSTVGH